MNEEVTIQQVLGQVGPPKAQTWARRGHPPVVTVTDKGSGRVSVAGTSDSPATAVLWC